MLPNNFWKSKRGPGSEGISVASKSFSLNSFLLNSFFLLLYFLLGSGLIFVRDNKKGLGHKLEANYIRNAILGHLMRHATQQARGYVILD